MPPEVVYVIGMGVEGRKSISQSTMDLIFSMDEVWGAERLLAEWQDLKLTKPLSGHRLVEEVQNLKVRGMKRIAVLASGDPGFFGIAKTILQFLPVEEVRMLPNVSSLQAAFARAGISWQDAVFTSVHARSIGELIGLARRHALLGVLTDPRQCPSLVAKVLLEAGIPDCRAIVFENLGTDRETMTDTRLSALDQKNFAPLNVMIFQSDEPFRQHHIGRIRPDDAYDTIKGMITKHDARLLSIERLEIEENDTIWDIGACSGAVSIECAERAWRGCVYAIEKNTNMLPFLKGNLLKHGAGYHVKIVEGEAPSVLTELPVPNAVFIGGTGGKLEEIFEHIAGLALDNCRVVANFTMIENLSRALSYLRQKGCQPNVVQADFAYGHKLGQGTRFDPNNPVYILSFTMKRLQK